MRASIALVATLAGLANAQGPYTLEQVKTYPFPTGLTAAGTGSRIAWAINDEGRRNVWVAEGPNFDARQLTDFNVDDGQEITSLQVSRNGQWVVFLRGGDFSSNFDDAQPVNVLNRPTPPRVQILSLPFDARAQRAQEPAIGIDNRPVRQAGAASRVLGEGEQPVISPNSDRVAFVRDRAIWVVPIDGSSAAKRIIAVKGDNNSPTWSPDGSKLAFVASRGDHSFIGIYTDDTTSITWIAPTTSRDVSPEWSPDGARIAFVRRPGGGGAPDSILAQRHTPWGIWVGDVRTGEARRVWQAPTTIRGSVPSTHGGYNLHWASGNRLVFLSYMDGWPHVYSISAEAGRPLLLTPGDYMAEYITMSPDGRYVLFTGNAGSHPDDVDRRHIVRVPVDRAAPEVLTPGMGLEWTPVMTGDNATIAFISATAQRPPVVAAMSAADRRVRWMDTTRIPATYPTSQLVTPRKVVFRAPDGVEIHAQLFDAQPARSSLRPAIIYVHGGPPRQMLLGWHYSDYYANAYAMNQYLASQGFIVLSVNYRLGIGYGREFQHPRGGGAQGATEYQDIRAAGEWLRRQPQVDGRRIGIYGGSYGGFLTALALARNSDLFAAGVDIHGVHDWTGERARPLLNRDRYETAPDVARALEIAWRSSPISSISTWRSPVLLIHGDDDRNVRFSQTVDLVQRLQRAGVPYEEVVIPDDTHHFMRHANQVRVNQLTAEFFSRVLQRARAN